MAVVADGAADGAVDGAVNVVAGVADDVADDVANDVAGSADDVASVADDVAGVADDVSGVAVDVAGVADDVAGVADDVAGVADSKKNQKKPNKAQQPTPTRGQGYQEAPRQISSQNSKNRNKPKTERAQPEHQPQNHVGAKQATVTVARKMGNVLNVKGGN